MGPGRAGTEIEVAADAIFVVVMMVMIAMAVLMGVLAVMRMSMLAGMVMRMTMHRAVRMHMVVLVPVLANFDFPRPTATNSTHRFAS
jgi:hypothetical protein